MLLTLQKRSILTISKEMRDALGIAPGDAMEALVVKGRLVLTPVAVVPRTLRLTASGERKESEAAGDVKRGRIAKFADAKGLLKDLNENRKNR
jgi:bifunctional DNA-binding transcriptional regulator/antitoxin component of YhaV-PrlF toxin-antitoxin module